MMRRGSLTHGLIAAFCAGACLSASAQEDLGSIIERGASVRTHVVTVPESLSAILYQAARRDGVKWPQLYGPGGLIERTLRLNPSIANPDLILPGTRIELPRLGEDSAEPAQGQSTAAPKAEAGPAPQESEPSLSGPTKVWCAGGEVVAEGVGANLSDRVEGYNTATDGRKSIGGEVSVHVDYRQAQEQSQDQGAESSYPRIGIFGAYLHHFKTHEISFPADYRVGAAGSLRNALRTRSFFLHPELSLSLERVGQGTPDVSPGGRSTAVRFIARSTRTLWLGAGACMTEFAPWSAFEPCARVARSLSSKSSTENGAAELDSLGGIGYQLNLRFQMLPQSSLRPFVQGRLEGFWLSSGDSSRVSGTELGLGLGIEL